MSKKYILPSVRELIDQTENGNHQFEVVSTFAGGGGSSLGYRMASGKVLAIVEFIDEACRTYQANWKNTKIIQQDIRLLTGEEILSAINKKVGELDILDGSPPCSAFSSLGDKDKGWGKLKKYSDSAQSNVEDLFFEYIRILRVIKPKIFIAENVRGLTQGAAKGYFNSILRELKQSGYHVEAKILDAKWLGVPQSRQRLIFVGVRDDLWRSEYAGKLHPKPLNYLVPLDVAFQGLEFTEADKRETDLSHYSIYEKLKLLKYGQTHQKNFSLTRSDPKKPAPCITATNAKKGAGTAYHWDCRAFTISELKRIMSVPDDYVLTGTAEQQRERIGRMVAPLVMKAVAENILNLGVLKNGNSKRGDVDFQK